MKLFTLFYLSLFQIASVYPQNSYPTKLLEPIAVYKTSVPEPSGLAYYEKNNTLLTVSDNKSKIYELNFEGKTLNSFKIKGRDLEGIALSASQDTILIVEESRHLVSKYNFDGKKLSSFRVSISTEKNHSLEGITVDGKNRIIVINEKNPCAMLIFEDRKEVFRKILDYTSDISDIFCERKGNILWVLSDESGMLLKLNINGELIKKYRIPFVKGEGVAVVGNKIFIINDSNSKLYVFNKPAE